MAQCHSEKADIRLTLNDLRVRTGDDPNGVRKVVAAARGGAAWRTADSPRHLAGRPGTGPFRREPFNSTGGTSTHERNHLHGLLRHI